MVRVRALHSSAESQVVFLAQSSLRATSPSSHQRLVSIYFAYAPGSRCSTHLLTLFQKQAVTPVHSSVVLDLALADHSVSA